MYFAEPAWRKNIVKFLFLPASWIFLKSRDFHKRFQNRERPALASCLQDGKTYHPCNSLPVNKNSFNIIITSSGPFSYCRNYENLVRTTHDSCILCSLPLDRDEHQGPSLIDKIQCTSDCHWPTYTAKKKFSFL